MKKKAELRELNGQKVLYVNGEPFFILGLQLNCDSCYRPDTIDTLMRNAEKMGCNSVALLLYWRLIEPEEGRYDMSILQAMLDSAERYHLKIVLVWFGSCKNATMHYAPDWLLRDKERFRRVRRKDGSIIDYVSCFLSEETMRKDIMAVSNVFSYLKEYDENRSVILFQVNNETGILGGTDRCYCDACNKRFLDEKYSERYPSFAEEAFLADIDLAYQETIAGHARAVYDLPCYMNAWLRQPTCTSKAGYTYPGGGPVDRVLEIYRQRKHYIDFVSPDVYTTGYRDFMRICTSYKAQNNPLYIAEHGLGRSSRAYKNLYYGIGEFAIIGFDPWAIDCAFPDVMEAPLCDGGSERWNDEAYDIRDSYVPIRDAMTPIMQNMGTDRLKYWVQEEGESTVTLSFRDTQIVVDYSNSAPITGACNFSAGGSTAGSRGIAIQLDDKSFLTIGCKSFVRFLNTNGEPKTIAYSARGRYEGGLFIEERQNTVMFETKRCCIWMNDAAVCLNILE